MLSKILEIQKLAILISEQTNDDIFCWYHGCGGMLHFSWHKGGFVNDEMPYVREDVWTREEDAKYKLDSILTMLWKAVEEYKIMFVEVV